MRCPGIQYKNIPISDMLIRNAISYAIGLLDAGRTDQAIGMLLALVDDTDDWTCRFYLALAYFESGQLLAARHQFVYITDKCPDIALRASALNLLRTLCRSDVA